MGPSHLSKDLEQNLAALRQRGGNSTDLIEHRLCLNGADCVLLFCDGMISQQLLGELLARPLLQARLPKPGGPELLRWLNEKALLAADQKTCDELEKLHSYLLSGFVALLADGADYAIVCGLQGFPQRAVSQPDTERNLRGAREAFVESVRSNQALIRRRVRSPKLKFELYPLENEAKSEVSLVYMTDRAKPEMVKQVKEQLAKSQADMILSSGYLQPFLEGRPLSLFSRVGVTERPDVLCAKINEGRIAILVDGTPFALIVPYLFHEHFQSLDDYAYRPYYALFIRLLKVGAFLLSMLLPGLYVALVVHNPEFLPEQLLFSIASAQQATPFPLLWEALFIHLIYEMMREAGLRLPQPVGHAVSIVGALVIGDAAVNAGLVSSPMVMIVALTAISAFVVPSLYEAVALLKFAFIILGGCWGVYGLALGLMALGLNLCALESEGVPMTAPLAPFAGRAMRDLFYRQSWRKLGRRQANIPTMPGSRYAKKQPPKEDA